MSMTMRKSSTKGGSGVISAITMPSTASGTAISPSMPEASACAHLARPARAGAGIAFAEIIRLTGEPPVHELEYVRQNLGHGPVELRRDLLADVDRRIQRSRQRRILDDRHLMFDGFLPDAQRQIVLALCDHERRGHGIELVANGDRIVRRVDHHRDRKSV